MIKVETNIKALFASQGTAASHHHLAFKAKGDLGISFQEYNSYEIPHYHFFSPTVGTQKQDGVVTFI